MIDLLLVSVAIVALLTIIRIGTFRTSPKQAKWLATGLGIIIATRFFGWIGLTYLSTVATIGTYSTFHRAISMTFDVSTAFAIAALVVASLASHQTKPPVTATEI